MNTSSVPTSEPPKSNSFSIGGIAAVTLGAILTFGNVHLLNRADKTDEQIKELRGAIKTEMLNLQQDSATRAKEQSSLLAELRDQIDQTGVKSTKAASQVNLMAKRYADQLAKKLSAQEKEAQEQQQALQEKMSAQFGEIRQASSQTEEKVSGIATDVTSVKSEVAQTKSDLDKAVNDLHSVRGDMGVQSGLIATNAKELATLKALGERSYFEFQLTKTKAPQKVGDVAVQLKKSDTKRNRYTIELVADDKHVEKKDRSINEPVQFYMAKARIPYEIVVNEVKNDRIIGYLAAPKIHEMR
jgi:hypothetical protein